VELDLRRRRSFDRRFVDDHGAAPPGALDQPFVGKLPVGRDHRVARETEPGGQPPRRRQRLAAQDLAARDGLVQPEVELPPERQRSIAIRRDARQPVGPGLVAGETFGSLGHHVDAASVGHVAFVHDGWPHTIPTAIARLDDSLWLHGSRSSRLYQVLAAGEPVAVSVCLVDALVKARSAFHCSMNYRSAVVYGRGVPVGGAAKREVLDRFTESLIPGSAGDYRAHLARELKATEQIRLPLDEASCKVRTGDPIDDDDDLSLSHWAGIIPLTTVSGTPRAAANLPAGIDLPPGLRP